MQDNIPPSVPLRQDKVRSVASVESSRGCHYGVCQFCARPMGSEKKWFRLNIETVVETINDLKRKGFPYFTFVDEDFIANDFEGVLNLSKELKKIGLPFSCSTRVDSIYNPKDSEELANKRLTTLDTLIDSGLCKMFLGVESVSDTQLFRYGKGFTVDTALKAVNILEKKGVDLELGFILL